MSSEPPRRRRSGPEEEERGGGLPMVPIFAGVIVAGLGIGALLSAFASRRAPSAPSPTPIVVTHTPTPIVQHTVAAATPASRSTPTPIATVAATTSPTPKTTSTPSSKPSPKPTEKPQAIQTPTVKPVPTPAHEPTPAVTKAPPVAIHTAAPPSPPVVETPVPPRVTVAPLPTNPQAFAAQNLVQRYLSAVAHGEDAAARSALGGSAGSRLTEQPYLDPTMRITSISSTRNADGGTRVQVEVSTARGTYFGTYTVDANGTAITDHSMIPVGGTTSR